MKDIAKKLDAFRANAAGGLYQPSNIAAALTTSQAAVDAAHQTALPLMLADARAKAQALASAAGVKLGAIPASPSRSTTPVELRPVLI